MDEKKIFVYENWSEEPVFIGTLYVSYVRGKEQFSFEYDKQWLSKVSTSNQLDPDLYLYQGRQFAPLDKSQFGIFSDSSPDRWGRMLMKRREAIQARKEDRKPRTLQESDFILGVYDEARMGALRFKTDREGDFLSDDKELATPPWTTLRTLEAASLGFENDESGLNEIWLKQLLAPGSSLGGARPKATVQDENGNLWIAKFPSKHDEWNSGAWEKVVHDLAKMCELNVPESKIKTFSETGSTFLVKRFDRRGKQRIHFASAMTLLGKVDGASGGDGSSYLDLVTFIKSNGASPKKDLFELWKRIVFNMLVSNTDDHLRNHGFIYHNHGWALSPLYDVNPIPYGNFLSLNVDMDDGLISLELALSVAEYFDLGKKEATDAANKMKKIVSENWRILAVKYGLSREACERMEPAFALCNE